MAKYPDVTAGQTEACINRLGGWTNFLRFIGGHGEVIFNSILTPIRTVFVPAQPALITSEKYFEEAEIKYLHILRLPFVRLKVEPTENEEIKVHRLEQSSVDGPILSELKAKAEISVSQFRESLLQNRDRPGEKFIAYLRDVEGTLRAVEAWWNIYAGGWLVDLSNVTGTERRAGGSWILSR